MPRNAIRVVLGQPHEQDDELQGELTLGSGAKCFLVAGDHRADPAHSDRTMPSTKVRASSQPMAAFDASPQSLVH